MRVGDDLVHEPHERVVRLLDLLFFVFGLGAELVAQLLRDHVHLAPLLAAAVIDLHGALEVFDGRHDRSHLRLREETHALQRIGVERVGHRDHEPALFVAERHDLALAHQLVGQRLQNARVDLEFREVDERNAELLTQDQIKLVLRERAQVDEDFAQVLLRIVPLQLQRNVQLLVRDEMKIDEQVAQLDDGDRALAFERRLQLLDGSDFIHGEQRRALGRAQGLDSHRLLELAVHALSKRGAGCQVKRIQHVVVEWRRIELPTSALRTRRSPS